MTTTNLGMPTRVRLTPAPPEGALIDSPPFPQAAIRELGKDTQRANLRHATHTLRTKRQRVVAELDHWQDLRSAGEAVKNRVARHLDTWLVQLEENLTRAGSTVHWARDAEEANRIIIDLIRATGSDEVVKVSHILVPAIHRNRTEVRDIFLEEMGRYGTPPPEGLDDDPGRLANAARAHLRDKFLRAKVAVSGANFAVAETGSLVVVESEGNGRMCLTLPQTLISVVGIEKVVPTFADLEVFLQLLPRSSTAERMNPYTTIWTGPTPGDGPQDVHVVLVDNGRTRALADPSGRAALRCIRCSACLNICPVFEKVGGHAYGSVYPGPIGAILNPQLRGVESAVDRSLPFASTLCGACDDVCPVKIPISDILVQQRHRIVEAKKAEAGRKPHLEPVLMKGGGWLMGDARRLALVQRAANVFGLVGGRTIGRIGNWPVPGLSRWLRARNVPMPPTASFRAQFDKTRGGQR